MPLGAARITLLAFQPSVEAEAEVIRRKVGVRADGNTQVDTAQSQFGGASALFNSTGDALRITFESTLDLSGDFTFECFARGGGTSGKLMMLYSHYPALSESIFIDAQTTIRCFIDGGNRITVGTWSTTVWNHLVLQRSNGVFNMWINGTRVMDYDQVTAIGYVRDYSLDNSQDHVIGSVWTSSAGYSAPWVGHIDELRWCEAAKYTNGASISVPTQPFTNDANTRVLLHMDGTDGSTLFEDDNGVRQKVGVKAVNETQIDTAQYQFGGSSAVFDGSNDHLVVSDFPGQRTDGAFTIEAWIRFDILPQTQTIGGGAYMMFVVAGSNDYISFGASNGDARVGFGSRFDNTNNYFGAIFTGTSWSINTWYHIAIIRQDDDLVRVFLDGVEASSYPTPNGHPNWYMSGEWYGSGFTIGKFTDSRGSWDGHIDEFRISDTARYTANFTPQSQPFVNDASTLALLHMDGTDGDTDFQDDNGVHTPGRTAVHVSPVGNAQVDTAQSQFGGASLLLDGSGDYLQADPGVSAYWRPISTDSWTWEGWYYLNAHANTRQTLFNARDGSNNGYTVEFDGNGSSTTGIIVTISGGNLEASYSFSLNTWYHIAWIYDAGTNYIFVDGVSQSVTGTAGSGLFATPTVNYMRLGRSPFSAERYFNGNMDEVRVSNTARYTANFTPSTTPFTDDANTLLLLHMNGADGSTSFPDDVGGRQKIGVIAVSNAQIDTAQSVFGGSSAVFDGDGDRLVTSLVPQYGTGDVTFECWFRSNSESAFHIIFDHRDVTSDNALAFVIANNQQGADNNTPYLFIQNSIPLRATTKMTLGTWFHLAVVRSQGVWRIYVNGTSEGGTYTNANDFTTANTLQISANKLTNTAPINGHLDEVRVSNIARYTANFTPSTVPFQNDDNTLLLLHMNGTDGSTVFTDDNGVTPNFDYGNE